MDVEEENMMDVSSCAGCYNDRYNDRVNFDGLRQCFSLRDAKVVTRFEIHRDTPMDRKDRFKRVQRPTCYHAPPMWYYDELPEHLRDEQCPHSSSA